MPRTDAKTGKRRPWLRWAIAAGAVFLLWQAAVGPRGLLKIAALRDERDALRREIDSLETRRHDLLEEKRRLLTDTAYLEKLARKELGMARPGEKVYRFIGTAGDSTGP